MSNASSIKERIDEMMAFPRNREPRERLRSKSYWLGYLEAARTYGGIDSGDWDMLYKHLQSIV